MSGKQLPLTENQKRYLINLQKLIAFVMAIVAVVSLLQGRLVDALLFVFGVAVMLALISETRKYSHRQEAKPVEQPVEKKPATKPRARKPVAK